MKFVFLLLGVVLLFGCTIQADTVSKDWKNVELKNVNTGEMFKISDFDGPVLLESFAVWCPTCTKQQKEIKKYHETTDDLVFSVSLDTDPNEDETKVKEHAEKHGFDWYYAVSPNELTQALIDEFGIGFVNAPSVPVVLICNGEARLLDGGVKTAEELKGELSKC